MRKFLLYSALILSLLAGLQNVESYTNINSPLQNGIIAFEDSLTAPGNFGILKVVGYHPARPVYEEIAFQFIITSTTNVTSVNVRVEASQDSVAWSNVNSLGTNTSINKDDNAIIIHTRVRSIQYYRGVFVDETGGTDGKVVLKVRGG